MVNICQCGCGENVKNKFKHGHNTRNTKHSLETRKKMSESLKGKKFSDERKRKISLSMMNKSPWNKGKKNEYKLSEEHKKNIGLGNKGKKMSLETIEKIKKKTTGRKHTIESKKKMSEVHKGKKLSIEHCNSIKNGQINSYIYNSERKSKLSQLMFNNWKDFEYAQRIFKSREVMPNKSEIKLDNILQKRFIKEWKYVGNGEMWVGGKCPDFVNINGKKMLIELYGDYWHKGEDGKDRINHFNNYGFKTLIIWEYELKNEENIFLKIDKFIQGESIC